MAKSAEVKLAIFGRAGVGKSGEVLLVAFIGSVSLSQLWGMGQVSGPHVVLPLSRGFTFHKQLMNSAYL